MIWRVGTILETVPTGANRVLDGTLDRNLLRLNSLALRNVYLSPFVRSLKSKNRANRIRLLFAEPSEVNVHYHLCRTCWPAYEI